jgi:NADPH-dependent curcumin reductase CurA
MNAIANRQFRLAARPEGAISASDFTFGTEPANAPAEGEVLVKVTYLSLDPAMRGWMRDAPSYIPPVQLGAVMRAGGVGVVVESRDPKFAPGDHVTGALNVQEYATIAGKSLTKIDTRMAPETVWLNVLGMPGMTAYFGLLDIGQPVAGQTVVVSGAAGAVGATVGQIAKIKGCRAVGIAGGPEKCAYLLELGFDAAIDYKNENVHAGLKQHCPDGIDIYFDNVGGDILDAALARLAMHARIVICGAISQYNSTSVQGPKNYLSLLVKRARMQGMVVFDYADRYAQGAMEMAGWMAQGKLKSREDVVDGLETFPDTLNKLFRGENFGKLVLKVAAD